MTVNSKWVVGGPTLRAIRVYCQRLEIPWNQVKPVSAAAKNILAGQAFYRDRLVNIRPEDIEMMGGRVIERSGQ